MRNCCVFLLVVFSFVSLAQADEQWNQYRGPQGNGHSSSKGLPTKWSDKENVKWTTKIHDKGWSSPVVWNKQVWLTTALKDGKEMYAVCVDFDSGEILHDIKVYDIEKPQSMYNAADRNSYASPTPVVEEGRVYVHFGVHGTACLDTATGKKIWSRQDLECNHFRGAASSPIVWNDLLILTFDGFDFQYLIALDKRTGETVWRTDRKFNYGTDNGDAMKSYSTPQVVDQEGKLQLVSASAGFCASYDPKSGKEIWRVKSGGMNSACRPVVAHGRAFLGTADGGFNLFAVDLDGEGDVTNSHVPWKLSKGAPRYSSPILVNDLLFMGSEQGVITCADAESGKAVWQERVGGVFVSSPVYGDGKLYFTNEEGATFVIEPSRDYKLLAKNELPGGFMASAAIQGKSLLFRSKEALWRIEE